MLRPAINNKTGAVDLINIELCPNLEDYVIVGIAKEANQESIDVKGNPIGTESPTRKKALKQEEDYENELINKAIEKNKINKKVVKKNTIK